MARLKPLRAGAENGTARRRRNRMGTCIAASLLLDAISLRRMESRVAEGVRPMSELDDIDALARTYRARLLRFVAYSTGDADLAETIAQDTLLRAYNGRASFRGECSVATWLTGIAIHVLRDMQRTERYRFWKRVKSTAIDVHEMASFLPADGSSPEAQLLAKEKVEHLAQALENLSKKQRTIFLMRFTEEMTVADIGEVLGMQIPTVRTHLHRALKAVRGELGARI